MSLSAYRAVCLINAQDEGKSQARFKKDDIKQIFSFAEAIHPPKELLCASKGWGSARPARASERHREIS